MKGKYLITTNNWFYAPDGKKYKAVWGEVSIMQDNVLGIKTNRQSSNWYAYIGNDICGMVIAGCQIYYAVKLHTRPNTDKVTEIGYSSTDCKEFTRDCEIYIAE